MNFQRIRRCNMGGAKNPQKIHNTFRGTIRGIVFSIQKLNSPRGFGALGGCQKWAQEAQISPRRPRKPQEAMMMSGSTWNQSSGSSGHSSVNSKTPKSARGARFFFTSSALLGSFSELRVWQEGRIKILKGRPSTSPSGSPPGLGVS